MEETKTIAGAILFGLGLIAAAIKWSAGRFSKTQERGITALVENAKSGATLTAKFETLVSRFDHLAARFDRIVEILVGDPKTPTRIPIQRPDTDDGGADGR